VIIARALITLTLALSMTQSVMAGQASTALPVKQLLQAPPLAGPVTNAAFAPGTDAQPAPAFNGLLTLHQVRLSTRPAIDKPLQDGRDARLFPAVSLEFFTLGDLLIPVRRGDMVRERSSATPSFWHVIPQIGKVWREKADGGWSRAAFPLMLVNDTDNDAHQGVATFLYQGAKISGITFQFTQQSAPYLLGQPFVAWGASAADYAASDAQLLTARQDTARLELSRRLPAKPWAELVAKTPAGTLDGFGGPINPAFLVVAALVRDGTLYYQDAGTPFGPYPYPLEMRFGVRSVMKSVGAPLALLHLAQVYGPWVLTLHIGDYVPGLDAKWNRVRFIDAANMASGFGGTGTLKTHPNDSLDGYVDGDYDGWYTAHSHADKVAKINANWHPYPWEPGTVMRYRDQDFYLLGAALNSFLKSLRGPDADLWNMLTEEVFNPIGIARLPAVRTRERDDHLGVTWLNAGFYPSLDDLAKIAMLYQSRGKFGAQQLLNADLTEDLLNSRGAIQKNADLSVPRSSSEPRAAGAEFYQMGFHFNPYLGSASHRRFDLPTMSGYGENEVTLFPTGMVSIVIGNASTFDPSQQIKSDRGPLTLQAVDRLSPF
jgi:hypothetical protein